MSGAGTSAVAKITITAATSTPSVVIPGLDLANAGGGVAPAATLLTTYLPAEPEVEVPATTKAAKGTRIFNGTTPRN